MFDGKDGLRHGDKPRSATILPFPTARVAARRAARRDGVKRADRLRAAHIIEDYAKLLSIRPHELVSLINSQRDSGAFPPEVIEAADHFRYSERMRFDAWGD